MAIMEKLAPISEHEATPSDHAFAAKGPYSTQHTEEVVSWIWDFSYIYSADTLGLDDSRSREENFCLRQYSSKNDWLRHEVLAHFQEREWIKTIDGSIRGGSASTDRSIYSMDSIHRVPQRRSSIYSSRCSNYGESNNQKSLQSVYNWFWVCGFCSDVLRSWDERQEHIAEHFENGMTMACWDPLKSPYPWIRSSVTPVQGLPRWDLKELFAIQRPSLIDSLNGIRKTPEPSSCERCHLPPRPKQASLKHLELWHLPRPSWSCPPISDRRGLAVFFDEVWYNRDGTSRYSCRCCGKLLECKQGEQHAHIEHLKEAHNFDEDSCCGNYLSEELFCLHLANSHHFPVDYMKDFMQHCETECRPPVRMMESLFPI